MSSFVGIKKQQQQKNNLDEKREHQKTRWRPCMQTVHADPHAILCKSTPNYTLIAHPPSHAPLFFFLFFLLFFFFITCCTSLTILVCVFMSHDSRITMRPIITILKAGHNFFFFFLNGEIIVRGWQLVGTVNHQVVCFNSWSNCYLLKTSCAQINKCQNIAFQENHWMHWWLVIQCTERYSRNKELSYF